MATQAAATDPQESADASPITISRPDDMHLHLRDGALMRDVVGFSERQFERAVIMPNLKPPVTTVNKARSYRERIMATLPRGSRFEPLMTLYLTDETPPIEIVRAYTSGFVHAVKYYPAGATTNSDTGVTDIKKVYGVLEEMQKQGLPLLLHGEVTDPTVDVFDREARFLKVFRELRKRFPALKMVLEHVTTKEAADAVMEEAKSGHPTAATITAHHLLENRNALFTGGLRPHFYCLPILKREEDRKALLAAATSGNPAFFLGTDSAPHPKELKEQDCGCAGCFTAANALELYAEAFDSIHALDKLEGFASHHGADFYGLPRNTGTVTLIRKTREIPASSPFGHSIVVPFRAKGTVRWEML